MRLFLIFGELTKTPSVRFSNRWTHLRLRLNGLVDDILMKCHIYRVLLNTMQHLSNIICNEFLHANIFDAQLWQSVFNLCATFVTQPLLQSMDKLTNNNHPTSLLTIKLYHRYDIIKYCNSVTNCHRITVHDIVDMVVICE